MVTQQEAAALLETLADRAKGLEPNEETLKVALRGIDSLNKLAQSSQPMQLSKEQARLLVMLFNADVGTGETAGARFAAMLEGAGYTSDDAQTERLQVYLTLTDIAGVAP